METLGTSSFSSFNLTMISTRFPRAQLQRAKSINPFDIQSNSSISLIPRDKVKFKLLTAISSTVSTEFADPPEQEIEIHRQQDKFDWFSQWYPIMPVCDLDKRVPHSKKVGSTL
ncbi:hypothetical protein F0562_024110 [Nyssa sinensis]|uniref:Pheophorbide a oxygenase domain-containing protein n=1 Tax=Nyssa sinensis TaxID=561372 RepID=A0A5J5BJV2_9ASTE|nr:hypothetical protein F0562_024110 [Nyssa sinensis]